jgi:hypothetical protein
MKVMDALNIQRMPSAAELVSVTKNQKIHNAIQRSYKYSGWAEKLGLDMKKSDSLLGKQYEYIAAIDILEQGGHDSEKMSQNYPFDLLVSGCIRVDVKVGNRYYYSSGKYYHTFNLEKKYPVCDIFLCYCLNDNSEVEKTYIIPSSEIQTTQLSIGVRSRYDKYLNTWDYFQKYYEFYNSLRI